MLNLGIELLEVLMHDDHPYPVFPKLGKHVRDRKRGEILEFVEIAVEGSAGLRGHLLAAERSKADCGNHEGAEER